MSEPLCDPTSLVSVISAVSGGTSFIIWLVAQIPQLLETYQTKSVDGLSPYFILIWLLGDLSNFIGCIFTEQMFFQYVIAGYFLFNDCVFLGQYYYYGYYLKTHHHGHNGHGHVRPNRRKSSKNSIVSSSSIGAAIIASNIGSSTALPIDILSNSSISTSNTRAIGTIFAWFGATCYFFSRIPQLYKNYQRKSTEDLSPFLFACTLLGNSTYTISILISCQFINDEEHRWEFFLNELPYMIGSAGTIVFDIFYFYQVWLYREPIEKNLGEEAPLLS